jgi:uncharacterized protein (TIGR02145 family)/uncharacterized repeat protein (TIGR02543 family)
MANITLYAKWTAAAYTLTANVSTQGGGTVSLSPNKDTYQYGEEVTVTATPAAGYKFTGWSGASDSKDASITVTMDDNYTLTAGFGKEGATQFTVTYNGNSNTGGSVPTAATADSGSSVTLPGQGTLAKPGYNFGGWNTNSAGTGTNYAAGASYKVTANVTLYAKWTAYPKYTVTYNGNSNSGGSVPTATTVDSGSVVTLSGQGTLARTGYNFGGWNTSNTGTGTDYAAGASYTVTGNVTLYAKWAAYPAYTVTYDGNNNTGGSVPTAATADSGSSVTLSGAGTLARTGYNFGGWNTNSTGTGTDYAAGASYKVTGDVTLYAKWTIKKYTVTYNGNGTTTGVPNANSDIDSGSAITLPGQGTMARTGYNFGGWNTNSTGTGTDYAAGASYKVTANVTMYAKWTAATYALTTSVSPSGCGTVSRNPSKDIYQYGEQVTVTATPEIEYMFTSWSGASTSTSSSITITMNDNKTLTAYFTVVTPTPWDTIRFTDNRDNKSYKAVTIGNQTWMAENLNYEPSSGNSWCYEKDDSYCSQYGRLYNWSTAMEVCPVGWHLPSRGEWNTLVDYVGGSLTAGKALKSTGGWYNNGNGTDDFGFSALPGGNRYYNDGSFFGAGNYGNWWAATEDSSGGAYCRSMYYYDDNVGEFNYYKSYGFSVRCVGD